MACRVAAQRGGARPASAVGRVTTISWCAPAYGPQVGLGGSVATARCRWHRDLLEGRIWTACLTADAHGLLSTGIGRGARPRLGSGLKV
jgi:hypothetical protein